MSKRAVILYWVLLLAPTLAIALAAGRLLQRERLRLDDQARLAARERALALAETLRAAVGSVEADVTARLRDLSAAALPDPLPEWGRTDPFVRNVFVWHPRDGLRYPRPGRPATAEEDRFTRRFDALFSGRKPWNTAPDDAAGRATAPTRRSRSQLLASTARQNHEASGWVPWFSENRLHLLGWVRDETSELVYGVELEFMILLSRLLPLFPDAPPAGVIYALLDGNGDVVHQAGALPIDPAGRPESQIALSPELPHWSVAVYRAPGTPPQRVGGALLALFGLLLLAFVAAIVSAGALLTREAYRGARDARRKTSFVANVSHELKTPLTNIRMYAELLEQGRVHDPATVRQYLGVVAAEAKRLTRLVNNVLDFGRLEQGRKTYRMEDVDLAAFVRQFVATHTVRIREAGMQLHETIPDAPVCVRADRDALEQILLNLVDNALKYAREGETIDLTVEQQRDSGYLRVMDRGPGIPAAHRKRVFETFHRIDDSLTTSQPGSGLGLSIARALVEGIGGQLTLRPRPGGGAAFTIVLPAATDKTETSS